jgi:hypothetical protein
MKTTLLASIVAVLTVALIRCPASAPPKLAGRQAANNHFTS